jgi:hypothetical protein
MWGQWVVNGQYGHFQLMSPVSQVHLMWAWTLRHKTSTMAVYNEHRGWGQHIRSMLLQPSNL